MKTAKLIKYKTSDFINHCKGEPYEIVHLTFEKTIFFFFKKRFTVEYHLTMFQDWKAWHEHWDRLIETEARIPLRECRNKIIF